MQSLYFFPVVAKTCQLVQLVPTGDDQWWLGMYGWLHTIALARLCFFLWEINKDI